MSDMKLDPLTRDWSEAKLQAEIIKRAHELGWLVQHSRRTTITRKDGSIRHATAISGDVGFPDLVLARNGRVAFLELKSETGTVDPDQKQWMGALTGGWHWNGWSSRDAAPDGAGFHARGGWTAAADVGDWTMLVAVIRPRHYRWLVQHLA